MLIAFVNANAVAEWLSSGDSGLNIQQSALSNQQF
jgi:hypothetical protein